MAVSKPTTIPRMAATAAAPSTAVNTTAPLSSQQDSGFAVGDKLPAQVLNWFLFWLYQWILWLNDLTNQALTWAAKQTINTGVAGAALTVTNTQSNGIAIYGTVAGDPAAVSAAIQGQTTGGKAYGVWGASGGSGAAIFGDASPAGCTAPAGRFVRSASRGAIAVDPVAGDPSAPQNGDIWYNSTTNTLRCYVNGAIKTFTVA